MKESLFKTRIAVVLIFVALAAIGLGFVAFTNSSSVKMRKQLDLGQKYLSELNYEQAVTTFKEALSIDPGSEAAMELLVTTYLEWGRNLYEEGNLEQAIEILKQGYEYTDYSELKTLLDDYQAEKDSILAEAEKKARAESSEKDRNSLEDEEDSVLQKVIDGQRQFLDNVKAGKYGENVALGIEDVISLIYQYQSTDEFSIECETGKNAGNENRKIGNDYISFNSVNEWGTGLGTRSETYFGARGEGWSVESTNSIGTSFVVDVLPMINGKVNGTGYRFVYQYGTDQNDMIEVIRIADGKAISSHYVIRNRGVTEEQESIYDRIWPDWHGK